MIQSFLFEIGNPGNLSQQRAQDLVEPFLPRLAGASQDAFAEFKMGIFTETRRKLYPQVRGQNVTNLIWEHVRDQLAELDGIEFCDRLGFFKVIIGNEIIVRFKRLNGELLAVSENTEQALAWFGNQHIDGVPDHLLRVNFGYRPAEDWESCSDFYFTHQSSFRTLAWLSRLEIVGDAETVTTEPHGLPELSIVPIAPPVQKVEKQA